ncbi:hypothetical protein F5884DRAFT_863482 [Xylogone sp. PMI_703]|nr:hypothetical protein F5884DRAFT_863482 [Xylogone sp. PMI_703]
MASEHQLAFYRNLTAAKILDSLISSFHKDIAQAGQVGPNADLEPRIRLLNKACQVKDVFCLALHQLYCLWSTDRKSQVRKILGPGEDCYIAPPMDILGHWLGSNKDIDVEWFSTRPVSLSDPRAPRLYRQVAANVGSFLAKMVSHWTQLVGECVTRGYPPLVGELVEQIGLVSPVLQHMMFQTVSRNMKICDNLQRNFSEVFDTDQRGYIYYISQKAKPEEVGNPDQNIRQMYNDILSKYPNGQIPVSLKLRHTSNSINTKPRHSTDNEWAVSKRDPGKYYDPVRDACDAVEPSSRR